MALEENVLDPRKDAYIGWLVTPEAERDPEVRSKAKYAAHIGVSQETLRRWEKDGVFRKEWAKRADEVVGSPERAQNVLDVLYNRAVAGDVKAADLYLRATNKLAPPTVKVEDTRPTSKLSDKELEELIGLSATAEVQKRLVAVK